MEENEDRTKLYFKMTLPNGSTLNPTTPLVDVFVYGTLKVGGALAKGLDRYRIKTVDGTTRGVLYRGPRYPMLVRSATVTDIVHGEVHTYPKVVLEMLDMIEGFSTKNPGGSLFIRERIPVYVSGMRACMPISMFAYLWRRPLEPSHKPIHNGNYAVNEQLMLGFDMTNDETGDLT